MSRIRFAAVLACSALIGCYSADELGGLGGGTAQPPGSGGDQNNWPGGDDDDDPASDGAAESELPATDGEGSAWDPTDDSLWDDVAEPTLQDGVHILEAGACYSSMDEDGMRLTFEFTCDPASLGMQVGDIVVGEARGGYLREITSLTFDGNTVVMDTVQGRFDQVFENGGFDAHLDLPSTARYRLDYSGEELYSGNVGGADLTVQLSEAVVNFDPDLRITTEFEWLRLNRARAVLDADVDLDLELMAQLSDELSYAKEIDLGEYSYNFAFAAGPVPVAGTLQVELKAGFSTAADATITATAGAEADVDVEVGASYFRGDRFSFTQRKSFEARRTGPDIEAEGHWEGRVYVTIEATVMMYRVAGPNFSVEPYVRGEADVACHDLDWQLHAGADLDAGLNLDVWVFELNKNFGPWNIERPIGDGTITLPIPIGTNCGPEPSLCNPVGTISCGQTITGDTAGDPGATTSMGAYPANVGNYDAPELVYTWQASTGSEVKFDFLNESPNELNHDIIILDGSVGQCVNTSAVAWGFNDVTFQPTAGNTYYIVVDGFDGDAGAFELELDCNP